MDKYILICTSDNLGTYMIYKYHHTNRDGDHEYRRYDDEGVIIYKTKHAAQRKVDKLNSIIGCTICGAMLNYHGEAHPCML